MASELGGVIDVECFTVRQRNSWLLLGLALRLSPVVIDLYCGCPLTWDCWKLVEAEEYDGE